MRTRTTPSKAGSVPRSLLLPRPWWLAMVWVVAVASAGSALAEDTPMLVSSRWWEAFQHPGLTAAIDQGLSAHPDTASALARIRAAEAGLAVARAGRRPEAGLEAGYRWGREQSVKTGGIEDDIDPLFGAARLSWELDLFDRRGAGIDAAAARAGQSEADLAGVRLLLSLEIARAYIDVAHLNGQMDLHRGEVEDARAILERAERRAASGLDPETERDLALAGWQEAEHRLMETGTERDRARARLTSLLGGTSPDEPPGSLKDITLPPAAGLANGERFLGRPDVVKAHLQWQEARGEARAASRSRLPTLSLVVSAAGEGEDAGDPERWEAWAGPVVSFPAWNPGLKAKSKRARAEEEAAEAALRAVSLRAVEEIDQAWAERSRSEAMIGHMQTRHEALESVAESASRKRAAGLIQEDTQRRARMQALQAARAELNWRAAALHAHLSLVAALGG